MDTQIKFTLKSSIFDRPRELTLSSEFLEFDDNDQISSIPTKFLRKDIEGFRYGVKGIRGDRFYIGRIYYIDIKSSSGQVIKLRLKSIYRIRRKELGAKYVKIVESLFKYYFNNIARKYLQWFRDQRSFEILGVKFNAEGICFDDKIGVVPWEFLGTRSYRRYYALFSETDPDQYKAFEYLDQWNTYVLHSVTEAILKMKFPQRKREPEETKK